MGGQNVALLLQRLMERIPEDTEERVDKTQKRVNTAVREMIRSGTGLLLNRQDAPRDKTFRKKVISVPVFLVPGLPVELMDLKFEGIDELVMLISPYRRKLEQSKNGLSDTLPLIKQLVNGEQGTALLGGNKDSFEDTLKLIKALLEKIDKRDPVKKILEINEDVLGRYCYKVYLPGQCPESILYDDPLNGWIELYWGLIGLVSGMLGTSIEALTAVVLIHEVAHAYTHLGADIDGIRWDSRWFANSDPALKEGLAQYYTHHITKRVDSQIPGTHEVFKELLKKQAAPYKTHECWVNDFPEEVRLAMIAIRRNEKGSLEEFGRRLGDAKQQLAGRIIKNL